MGKSLSGIAVAVGVILRLLTTQLYAEPPLYKEALTLSSRSIGTARAAPACLQTPTRVVGRL